MSPHPTVTVDGDHVRLREATCVPAPAHLPRVVIGVGRSKDTLQQAATYADELNVYDSPGLIEEASELARVSPRAMNDSVFADSSWDRWPPDPGKVIASWADRGVGRCFLSIGGADMRARIGSLATHAGSG